jgi:hypothetical protein
MGTNSSSLGVESPGHEADRSHPSSAEVKDFVKLYFHSFNKHSWRGVKINISGKI